MWVLLGCGAIMMGRSSGNRSRDFEAPEYSSIGRYFGRSGRDFVVVDTSFQCDEKSKALSVTTGSSRACLSVGFEPDTSSWINKEVLDYTSREHFNFNSLWHRFLDDE